MHMIQWNDQTIVSTSKLYHLRVDKYPILFGSQFIRSIRERDTTMQMWCSLANMKASFVLDSGHIKLDHIMNEYIMYVCDCQQS
jgi:hypothetical protein